MLSLPSSVFKKKHHALSYHRIREATAAGIIHFCHLPSEMNLADVLNKPLNNESFHRLIKPVMFSDWDTIRWPWLDPKLKELLEERKKKSTSTSTEGVNQNQDEIFPGKKS